MMMPRIYQTDFTLTTTVTNVVSVFSGQGAQPVNSASDLDLALGSSIDKLFVARSRENIYGSPLVC